MSSTRYRPARSRSCPRTARRRKCTPRLNAAGCVSLTRPARSVRKVHVEVRRYVRLGYRVILIGHTGHDEVIGTTGQAPDATVLVENLGDVARLELAPDERGVVLTQTTLSQDDTHAIVAALRTRFPHLERPPSG